jgi:hypothetical protein
MNETRGYTVNWLCLLIVYLLAGWLIYTIGWGDRNLWMIYGVMLLVLLVFNIMGAIGVIFAWRIHHKSGDNKVLDWDSIDA